jgi:uncharacterized membrane protein YraQ (UPF0718 family)
MVKNKLKNIPAEFKMSIFLIVLSFALLISFNKNVLELLSDNLDMIIKILYLTCFAVVISTIIHYLLPVDFVKERLKENKVIYLFYASVFGILTPGPVYAIYPILLVLKKKGIQNPILVAYITGQTIVGPARIPFEVGLFGLDFFLYRILLSLIMGPLAGILYILFSKVIPDLE